MDIPRNKTFLKTGELLSPPDLQERIVTLQKHLYYSIQWKGERTGIFEMRRHYTNYLKGLPTLKPYRQLLIEATDLTTIESILVEMLGKSIAA